MGADRKLQAYWICNPVLIIMKKHLIAGILLLPLLALAQTKTTEALEKKYNGFKLYFYKNTLRMLNQKEDKNFDELIKDIEKMRFLMINKTKGTFNDTEYKQLLKSYRSESYDEVMTSRFQGREFDVYVRESGGRVKGTVIVANDSTNLFVLDILGRVELSKATSLFQAIGGNTDIGVKIKDFMGGSDSHKEKKKNRKGIVID